MKLSHNLANFFDVMLSSAKHLDFSRLAKARFFG
jgi:hypothetical protein